MQVHMQVLVYAGQIAQDGDKYVGYGNVGRRQLSNQDAVGVIEIKDRVSGD